MRSDHGTRMRKLFRMAGGLRAIRYLNRKRVRILMYHRFEGSSGVAMLFRRQCAYIASAFRVLPLTEVASALHDGRTLPDNATVITVDDGYRDFFDVAYPILREYRLPATVFVVTDFVDGKDWLWMDQVRYSIQRTKLQHFDLAVPGADTVRLELNQTQQRSHAAELLNRMAKGLPDSARRDMIHRLPELLGVDLPREAPDDYAPLTWDMIRRMAGDGFEFGPHTLTHPILPRMENESGLRQEIIQSKIRVEQELGTAAPHFCYPNGDFDDRSIEAVKGAGFQSAVTVERGLNAPGSDPFLLKRIGVEPDTPEANFQQWSSGSVRGTII